MLAHYTVEFALPAHQHPPNSQHRTDDPVALKEFLSELLEIRSWEGKGKSGF